MPGSTPVVAAWTAGLADTAEKLIALVLIVVTAASRAKVLPPLAVPEATKAQLARFILTAASKSVARSQMPLRLSTTLQMPFWLALDWLLTNTRSPSASVTPSTLAGAPVKTTHA
ncbi:MAG: hypothetical protein IPO15_04760 [Anaerolineae bacterium]|uniref:hypothetical protein n=1 Tax=Candidatus Amarolinea dominans TaxID=3140696 RepID=UPI0031354E34|nr:hypothetical protein [Anaerolineae bacterium]